MKDVEVLEVKKLKVMRFRMLALRSAANFNGTALIQFDDKSSNKDGIPETGAVQAKAKGYGGTSSGSQGYGFSYP